MDEPLDPETGTPGGLRKEHALPTDFRGGRFVRRRRIWSYEGGAPVYTGRLRAGIRWIERLDAELSGDRDPWSGVTTPAEAVDHLLERRHKITDPDELWLCRFLLAKCDQGRAEAKAEADREDGDGDSDRGDQSLT